MGKRYWLCIIALLCFICFNKKLIQSSEYPNLDGMKNKIYLVPVGSIEQLVLNSLAQKLQETFDCPVEVYKEMEIPKEAYNPSRRQYSSSSILKEIHSVIKPDGEKKALGIADVDLYVSGLNFVFGEAELGGHFAIISLTRLRQSFYGHPEDNTLFLERAAKEAVHELGHVFGLRHCPDAECVMHFSNSLWDTDRKKASFCARCQKILEKLKR